MRFSELADVPIVKGGLDVAFYGRERRPIQGRQPYLAAARTLLVESGCTVRNWRKSNTGSAWTKSEDWGIEVPIPRGPLSYGTLAHEVAHQTLHRGGSTPRWLEEIEAWEWSLATFDRFDLPGADRLQRDASKHLAQVVARKTLRHSKHPESMLLRMHGRWPIWAIADLVHVDAQGIYRAPETSS